MGLGSQERGLGITKIAGEVDSLMLQQQHKESKSTPAQCPRCDSKNTKFCYYNNYSKLQPRHFCKACRRYWTKGGVLRDVPVGRSRKNKRLKTTHDAAIDEVDVKSCSRIIAAGQQPLMPSDACSETLLREALLLHPPQLTLPAPWDCSAGTYAESDVPAALPLPEYFAWAEEPAAILSYGSEDTFDPFSPLSSSSCLWSLDDQARRESRLLAVDGGPSSLQEQHAGSYLSCWDEVFNFVDLELKPPASE